MEPVRLRDLDGADASLREDLAVVAAEDVDYDVAAGAARFEAGLAAGLPLPADPASASHVLAWLGIGAGVVGVAAIAWVVGRSPSVDVPAPKKAAVVERAPAQAPIVAAVERAPVVSPPPAVAETEPAVVEPAPAVVAPRKGEKKPIVAPPADDDRLQREMAATRAADKALASDPARALELVKAADREFSGGMFAEDREGIVALAKLALGKGDTDARKYVSAHPKGTFAQRVRKALDDQGE